MKNGESYKNSRRAFLKNIAGFALIVTVLQGCGKNVKSMLVKLTGTNHILGHRLWAKNFPEISKQIQIPYLIIGGGIAGLSAARQLKKQGIDNFIILEMEGHTGGNSSGGENFYSKYPLGAHYLPLPNFHDKELIAFLHEEGIITAFNNNGFPEFDEQQLAFSPQERLFFRNTWQEGLVPRYGNTHAVEKDFSRFFNMMDIYREAKGIDDRYIFDIPLHISSKDEKFIELDCITMKTWLNKNGFRSEELYEYTDYCCRDDFGLGIEYVSAWAGVHYFAARKHNAGNNYNQNVLTWPEGNARLASHLKKYSKGKTMTDTLAFDVAIAEGKVITKAYESSTANTIEIVSDKVIICTPQFVNKYLFHERKNYTKQFTYAPWLLATLMLKQLPEDTDQPLSWDNVIYKGKGLGYIYDQHQSLKQVQDKKVITYYHSFSSADSKATRKQIYKKDKAYWKKFVIDDIKTAHPAIENLIEEINIHILGHGMISPVPNFLSGEARKKASQSIENKIYFAHSDLSGISIFEEAFHQGIKAVNDILHETTVD